MTTVDESRRTRTTPQLMRQAVDEARQLVDAELQQAKREIKAELGAVRRAAILLGSAGLVALLALTLLLVAVALVLPVSPFAGVLIVAGVMAVAAGVLAWAGRESLPRKPLRRTRERLQRDLSRGKELLQ